MRLGVFGGTFDPIHYGHLLLAEQCREQCRLDEVWFIPAGSPPHKSAHAVTTGKVRADMVDMAIAGHPDFRVNRLELDRSGPSFTVDTLEQIQQQDASRELFFLVGADSLADLPLWYHPRRIAELATLVVVNRGGASWPDVEPLRPPLGDAAVDRIQVVSIPAIDLSASDIRRRARDGRSIRFMTPRSVECYILEHGVFLQKE